MLGILILAILIAAAVLVMRGLASMENQSPEDKSHTRKKILSFYVFFGIVIFGTIAYFNNQTLTTDQKVFMKKIQTQVHRKYPEITLKQKGFGWDYKGKDRKGWIGLDNAYAVYKNGQSLPKIVDDYIGASINIKNESKLAWADVKGRLLPAIKPPDFVEGSREMITDKHPEQMLLTIDYREGLKILLAIDSEKSMQYVTLGDAKRWNKTKEQIYEIAINNLSERTKPLWDTSISAAKKEKVFVFSSMDAYDASRILLPEFQTRVSSALGCKKIAVAIPFRDAVVAVSAEDPKRVGKFIEVVNEDYEKNAYKITPEVFFLPDADMKSNGSASKTASGKE
jgi:uncharacterized protein YtpQ (UPF0354 family)